MTEHSAISPRTAVSWYIGLAAFFAGTVAILLFGILSVPVEQRELAKEFLKAACLLTPEGRVAKAVNLDPEIMTRAYDLPQMEPARGDDKAELSGTVMALDGTTVRKFDAAMVKFVDCP